MGSVVATVILAIAIGFAVGLLAGMLGVGGGSILLPVFRVVFGLSAVGSTATSLFTIIPTSVSGAIAHLRNKTCIPKLGIALGVGGALTSPLGVQLAQMSPGWLVMLAAAAVIIYTSTTMFRKALAVPKAPKRSTASTGRKAPKSAASASSASSAHAAAGGSISSDAQASAHAQAASAAEAPNADAFTIDRKVLVGAIAIGALAGVGSGYIGLGGGFIMVPLMISLLHMPMKLTSGTSLIAIMILATPATITQCMLGNVDLLIGISIACGSIPGATLGARLTKRLPERTLRFAFSAMLVTGAILLIAKELVLVL